MHSYAERQHHRLRLMKRWKRILSRWYVTPGFVALNMRLRTKTRTPCSCWMCGNRRKHAGQTHAEYIADLSWQEQITDVDKHGT
jgi:hypothetical protein